AAEARLRGEPRDPAVFAAAAAGLRSHAEGERIDTVVLACTHFPLVVNELRAALGPDIAFVHGAAGIARRIAFLTQGQPFLRKSPDAAIFTGDLSAAQRLRPAIEAHGLMEIESL